MSCPPSRGLGRCRILCWEARGRGSDTWTGGGLVWFLMPVECLGLWDGFCPVRVQRKPRAHTDLNKPGSFQTFFERLLGRVFVPSCRGCPPKPAARLPANLGASGLRAGHDQFALFIPGFLSAAAATSPFSRANNLRRHFAVLLAHVVSAHHSDSKSGLTLAQSQP